ncbi:MAG: OmpA family protein [Paracoccaceae bacterium]|nr:OmpA family protein [Paracoccaceae bacterium]
MSKQSKILILAVSSFALTACGDGTVLDSWTQESGSFIDEGKFGNPTMNNTLVQTGQRDVLVDLNNRFASEVNPMVNFAFNSDQLDAESMRTLDKQADWISQFPEIWFRVYGHTDLVGSEEYNKDLGMRRARAVVDYLVSRGIEESRLEAVVSYGETQPLIMTEDRERQNRRTVTEVTGFTQNAGALLNGKYAQVIFREYVASATVSSETGAATLADVGGG